MSAGLCADCGDRSTTLKAWDEGYDYAFWTRQPRYTDLCAECWRKRDNYEPPDMDGEEMFRDHAAEQRDALGEAQRLKR